MRLLPTLLLLPFFAGLSGAQMILTTGFPGGNGCRGNYFDVEATGTAAVTILTMDIHMDTAPPPTTTVELWTRPGSWVGFATSSAGWTQVGMGAVTGAGAGLPTPLPFAVNMVIPPGQIQAFLVAVPDHDIGYTNGSGSFTSVLASDSNLTIYEGGGHCSTSVFNGHNAPRNWNGRIHYELAPSCVINAPLAAALASGVVGVDFDVDHPTSLPVDAAFDWSTDAGVSWNSCAAGGLSVNPTLGLTTPGAGLLFEWDSFADGIGLAAPEMADLRITLDDGTTQGSCIVAGLQIDNVAPPPTCTLTLTSGVPVSNVALFDLTPDSMNAATVDATLEYSLDAGATWNLATPDSSSTNPMIGLPIGVLATFGWDSRFDGVGLVALVPGVVVRATVDDAVAVTPGSCLAAPFDVDNTMLCSGICGDCNQDGAGPGILDALVAAQIAAGLLTPTMLQMACCDVDVSGTVAVIDALLMAQTAAGFMVTLTCA